MTRSEKLHFGMLCLTGRILSLTGFYGTRFFGRALGWLIWSCVPCRRKLAVRNISSHLHIPEREAERICRASFLNTGQSFFEILLTDRFPLDNRMLTYDTAELFEKLCTCRRPIVAVTAHFGAWELQASLLGLAFKDGRPRQVIVRQYGSEAVNSFIKSHREATGAQMIGHRNAIPSVLRALRQNGIAAFLVDHNTKKEEAVFLPFLGEEAAVNVGPALLAVRTKALVWPLVLSRVGKNYVYHLQEPLDTAQLDGTSEERIMKTARFYTEAMEKFIRKEPEQWFWMHDRWKTKSRTAADAGQEE